MDIIAPAPSPGKLAIAGTVEEVLRSLLDYGVTFITEKIVPVVELCTAYAYERMFSFLDRIELTLATRLVTLVTLQASDPENSSMHEAEYRRVARLFSDQVLNPGKLEEVRFYLDSLRDRLLPQLA